jgi:carboxylesterase
VDAVVTIPGAEPFSAAGYLPHSRLGVLVLHGFTGSPIAVRPLGERIAEAGYQVELPLLPGHGTTSADLAGTRYPDWYDDAERVLDHLAAHAERVVVCGFSVGGTIALDLAVRRADVVSGVVTLNALIRDPWPVLARPVRFAGRWVPALPRRWVRMPPDDVARPGSGEPAYPRVPIAPLRSLLDELPRIRSQLGELTTPLLVVRSLVDHVVDPADSLEILRSVTNERRREVVCERSLHLVALDHDATAVESEVLQFLAELHDDGVGA